MGVGVGVSRCGCLYLDFLLKGFFLRLIFGKECYHDKKCSAKIRSWSREITREKKSHLITKNKNVCESLTFLIVKKCYRDLDF